ncbi:MAG: lipopolysaccharide kinase InaA family protein [Gemmatimonadaceae bacterium]|nr:lipopolysaccharide kinase InaA family protein [Gemmatimonadaceae bacterium]
MIRPAPAGYAALDIGDARVVVHERFADTLRTVLEGHPSVYEWASSHPERREMHGRLSVFAVPLPNGGPGVVVRRSHHGGLMAQVLRDLFVPPTRARAELDISLMLAQSGVPTPPVVAFAIYKVGPLFRRVDVITVELPGRDLGTALCEAAAPEERRALVQPVAVMLGALTEAGVWHPDLNVKNILLVPDDAGALHPAVLDVDRVSFVPPGDPNLREANFRRLARSMAKWRGLHGVGFTDHELEDIRNALLRDEAVQAAHRALAMDEFMP